MCDTRCLVVFRLVLLSAIYSCGINDNFRSCLLGKLVVVVALRYAQYCSKKHLFRFRMRWGSALTANVTQQPLESTISGLKCSRCISKTSCSKKRFYHRFQVTQSIYLAYTTNDSVGVTFSPSHELRRMKPLKGDVVNFTPIPTWINA